MRLNELIRGLNLDVRVGARASGDARICDFTEDSRTAMPGSLFVARPGLVSDGGSTSPTRSRPVPSRCSRTPAARGRSRTGPWHW